MLVAPPSPFLSAQAMGSLLGHTHSFLLWVWVEHGADGIRTRMGPL